VTWSGVSPSTENQENTVVTATSRKVAVLTVTAVTATTAVLGASAATAHAARPAKPATAGVTGSAEFALPYSPDDDVRSFSFDAHGAPYTVPRPGLPPELPGLPTDARGTVKISHYVAEQKITVRAEGDVECLVTGPRSATLTAIVTKADPLVKDMIGTRVGFSVYDGGEDRAGRSHDRVGFSWDLVNLDQNDKGELQTAKVGTCMAPAPFAPVTKGGYTVKHADLLPVPTH
jgi:hypothetical protein